jgi:E2F/DP family winged-helix DNA-binding domain
MPPTASAHTFIPISVAANTTTTNSCASVASSSSYSRKKKSLGVLAETILDKYRPCGHGTQIVIDSLAQELGVERRRIYDVINILESVQMLTKRAKNTYDWQGMSHLPQFLSLLQEEGLTSLRQMHQAEYPGPQPSRILTWRPRKGHKSLSRLSQQFLQCFLLGHTQLSLPEASDMIHGESLSDHDLALLVTDSVPQDETLLQQAAARGLKTKIRRLYDIANVMAAVGLLQKVDEKAHSSPKRPVYQWTYYLSITDLSNLRHEGKLKNHQEVSNVNNENCTSGLGYSSSSGSSSKGSIGSSSNSNNKKGSAKDNRNPLQHIHQTGGAMTSEDIRRVSLEESDHYV